MTCPNCGYEAPSQQNFCSRCGCPMTKKAPKWPPILLMLAMIAVSMVVYLVTSSPSAEPAGSCFHLEGNTLYFDASRYTGGSELTIPEQVDGSTVFAISDACFAGNTDLTAVILPNTVTQIGEGAFAGCTALRGIYLPIGVTYVADSAFAGCTGLEAVWINTGLSFIGDAAFEECTNLRFIYYMGDHFQWQKLYTEGIGPNTQVFCKDGIFFQSDD